MRKCGVHDKDNILVVCTRRIGDVILCLPAMKELSDKYPNALIDLLCFAGTEDLPRKISYINKVIVVKQRPTLVDHWELIKKIFRRYNIAISFLPGDRPVLYSWIASGNNVGCIAKNCKNFWKRGFLKRWIAHDDINTHTVVMNLRVIELLNTNKPCQIQDEFILFHEEPKPTKALSSNHPYVIFHISPKYVYKRWSLRGWQLLAHCLSKHAGLNIILSGGGERSERIYSEELMLKMPKNTINLVGMMEITELSVGIRNAAIYVGLDTAVTHLAAMIGTPTVALFGPSNPRKWGPWPKGYNSQIGSSPWSIKGSQRIRNVFLIQGESDCVPCMLEGCFNHKASESRCLQELDSRRVFNAAMEMLHP